MILHNLHTHPQQKPHSHHRHAVPLESILSPLRLRQVLSPPLLHICLSRVLPQLFLEPRRSSRILPLLSRRTRPSCRRRRSRRLAPRKSRKRAPWMHFRRPCHLFVPHFTFQNPQLSTTF